MYTSALLWLGAFFTGVGLALAGLVIWMLRDDRPKPKVDVVRKAPVRRAPPTREDRVRGTVLALERMRAQALRPLEVALGTSRPGETCGDAVNRRPLARHVRESMSQRLVPALAAAFSEVLQGKELGHAGLDEVRATLGQSHVKSTLDSWLRRAADPATSPGDLERGLVVLDNEVAQLALTVTQAVDSHTLDVGALLEDVCARATGKVRVGARYAPGLPLIPVANKDATWSEVHRSLDALIARAVATGKALVQISAALSEDGALVVLRCEDGAPGIELPTR